MSQESGLRTAIASTQRPALLPNGIRWLAALESAVVSCVMAARRAVQRGNPFPSQLDTHYLGRRHQRLLKTAGQMPASLPRAAPRPSSSVTAPPSSSSLPASVVSRVYLYVAGPWRTRPKRLHPGLAQPACALVVHFEEEEAMSESTEDLKSAAEELVDPARHSINRAAVAPLARFWWIELLAGAFWLVVAAVVLKFNHASVT